MERGGRINIVYVTGSPFKVKENEIYREHFKIQGSLVNDRFEFDIREVNIKEVLEVDLHTMVAEEVKKAYEQLRVPCIVEHAGLIFEEYLDLSYPGGLTKAMWNALGSHFVKETNSAGRRAIARAVVAYCDGQKIDTFSGETAGRISKEPKGSREFYWDTVFVPDIESDTEGSLTYAEIVDDPNLGLEHKVCNLSQSSKAMTKFLSHLLECGVSPFWRSHS